MKKLIAALAFFVGLNVNAGLISIVTSDTNVDIGETVTVNLNATGFGLFDTFDLDFDFNTSIFSYDASTLLTDLDFFLFEVNQVPDGMALSGLDFSPVDGDFLLASFDLIAESAGVATFSMGDALFSEFLSDLDTDTSDTQSIEVSTPIVQVSTPATLGIFAIAAFAFAGFRRKA
jgi:hypothetical protein